MSHKYAIDLVSSGTIYLTNAEEFRRDSTVERGDPTETNGHFIRQGASCRTGHTNPIFLWCTTKESNPIALLETWKDCDTVICIHNPQKFAERMLQTAIAQGIKGLALHAGCTLYDKCRGSVAPYHWSESIFQKPGCYSHQQEYRFALVGKYDIKKDKHVILTLGSCKGLVTISANQAL